ncbi:MAG TPA: hypothetical protein VMV47_19320 [Bacteroidales bacterium]|nr:hypothetical protein [Bacteroidales bacterium]
METNSNSTEVSKWSVLKRKIRKVLNLLLILIVIITGSFIYYKYYHTYSDGYRTGLLHKFSHKGNLFKTYEGEMILSSVTSNPSVALASEKFFFSVTSQDLAAQLDTIQGRMVIVHYLQKNGALLWRGDSEYLVDSVKRMR